LASGRRLQPHGATLQSCTKGWKQKVREKTKRIEAQRARLEALVRGQRLPGTASTIEELATAFRSACAW
jgi:two-component system nitrate/nitrite sensor histidine kinase NarX